MRKAIDAIVHLPYWVLYHAWTLFLFTKADFTVLVLPVTCLAAASTPLASPSRLPHVIFWTWLQVLELDLSNQTLDPEEDKQNKPYRPLPAKRISLRAATTLRWILPFVCWTWSASYSREVLYASFALSALVLIYDELGFTMCHWFTRNALNVFGHASFQVGACLLAGNNVHTLDSISSLSILCSAGVVLTTIHAQDFKDTIGDAAVGRRTLPIVHPTIARPALMIIVIAWSIALSVIWHLHIAAAVPFITLGSAVGVLFVTQTSVKADRRSLSLYMIWLSIAHLLPAYFRFFVGTPVAAS